MRRPNFPLRRQVLATCLMCLPGAGLLFVLAVLEALDPVVALAALAGLALITWPIVRIYLADITAFVAFIDALAQGDDTERPRFALAMVAEELATATGGLLQAWRRHRETLRMLTAASQGIIDGLPDPLLTVDGQRRVVRLNAEARERFPEARPERDLATVLRNPQLLAAVDKALAEGTPARVEFPLSGQVETVLAAHIRALPEPADDGSLVLVVLHDLTALRRTERMRADFVANASHELKTPISMLIGFIETLRGPARDDPAARDRFLGIMDEQAQRMSRLVNDLLSLSGIELREHSRPQEAVEIVPVIRSVLDMFELRARQRAVTLKLTTEGEPGAVIGDKDELSQVFQNLIDNAIKYSRTGTAVTVSLKRGPARGGPGETVTASVRDQGDGIPPQHLPRLTERFYRVDTARSRQMGGTGLGLAIVKHIVNRHRGQLVIDSVVGEGSTFAITLPGAPAAAPRPAQPAATTTERRRA